MASINVCALYNRRYKIRDDSRVKWKQNIVKPTAWMRWERPTGHVCHHADLFVCYILPSRQNARGQVQYMIVSKHPWWGRQRVFALSIIHLFFMDEIIYVGRMIKWLCVCFWIHVIPTQQSLKNTSWRQNFRHVVNKFVMTSKTCDDVKNTS